MGRPLHRFVAFTPFVVFGGLVLLTALGTSHLSMAYMPGLGTGRIASPPLAVLVIGALAAMLIGLLLAARNDKSLRLTLPLVVTAAPLGYSVLRSSGLGALSVAGPAVAIDERIGWVASAGMAHLSALLSVAALVSGYALTLALREVVQWSGARPHHALHWWWGALAAALASAFIALIVATSTGVDVVSATMRWGGCGVALLAVVIVALGSGGRSTAVVRDTVCLCFLLTVLVSLLAQREYVEALAADVLMRENPWSNPGQYVAGLREVAAAVEPRETFGPILGLVPWLLLCTRGMRSRLRNAIPAMVAGVVIAAVALGTSHQLDVRAAAASADATPSADARDDRGDVLRWSERVLPRTVPWVVARRAEMDAAPTCLNAPTGRARLRECL